MLNGRLVLSEKLIVMLAMVVIVCLISLFILLDIFLYLPMLIICLYFVIFSIFIVNKNFYKLITFLKRVNKNYFLVTFFYIGCLSFRVRNVDTIEENPIDGAAVFRIIVWMAPILILFIQASIKKKFRYFSARSIMGVLLFYGTIALISTIYSVSKFLTLYRSIELLIVVFTTIFIINQIKNRKELIDFLNFNIFMIFCLLLSTWLVFIFNPQLASFGLDGSGTKFQLGGAFIHPNALGTLGAIVFGIAVMRLTSPVYSKEHLLYIWIGLLSLCTVILSVSRTNLLIMVLVTFFALFLKRKYTLILYLTICSSISVIGIPMIRETLWSYFSRGQSTELLFSFSERFPIWKAAIGVIKESLILGNGFVSSRIIMPLAYNVPYFSPTSAHNSFLDVLVNLGILGLIPIIVIFVYMWLTNIKLILNPNNRNLGVEIFIIIFSVSLAAITGISFGSQVDHKFLITIITISIMYKFGTRHIIE